MRGAGGIRLIGKRLMELRKDAKLTQDELGAILNINKHSISSYEREKSEPPDAIKVEIARYFKVSVDYLLGLTDNPSPYGSSHNVLRLPSRFPEKARSSLDDYAHFLSERYGEEDGP